ncbi:MAG: hypothetical protein A2W05_02130 [Candidatus Schekmanbacteria bacterium RBG_16_38_10]|uniref:BACON domain-containing protein n=1 Tax=Candidatus Schekmanbacteria bacterium RBG_16_38_10 TaxID=1817879 RepID=A0A1F7RNK7_9BACT|nr:MAG: hypothetical protein A2W05_02130 [Candidatus Schekmanbacteria bacterium RBG_16_38_10]
MNKKLFLILFILIPLSIITNNTYAASQKIAEGDSQNITTAKKASSEIKEGTTEMKEERTIRRTTSTTKTKTTTSSSTTTITNQLIANGIAPSYDFGSVYIGKEIPSGSMTETFTITTQTSEAAGWLLTSYPQWLKITPASGTTPNRVVMEVIDTGRLNAGLNSESLIFQSTKNGVNPLTINVSITGIPNFN